MRYLKIDAALHKVEPIEATTFREAERMCGLEPGAVDFATLVLNSDHSGLSIVVYEYGLFRPPVNSHYFSIGRRLYEGDALVFAFAAGGATVDIGKQVIAPRWFATGQEVEAAIERGEIDRPKRYDGWQWPQPAPQGMSPT